MSGLKLQVLSNPRSSPSFVIGNPQAVRRKKAGLAKSAKTRENQSPRSHSVAKRRTHKRNPFVATAVRGKRKMKLGAVKYSRDERHALVGRPVKLVGRKSGKVRKSVKGGAAGLRATLRTAKLSPELRAKGKARLKELTRQLRASKKKMSSTIKKARKLKRKGWKIQTKFMSAEAAEKFMAKKKRRKSKKKSSVKHVKRRKKAKAHKPKKHKRKAHKAAPKRRRKKHALKAVRRRKKARKHSAKRRHRKARKHAAPKRHKRRRLSKKAKAARRRKARSRKYWSARRHSHHLHVSVKGMRKGGKRSRKFKLGRKRYSVSTIRRNPGGSMPNKIKDFLTAGDSKQAVHLVVAAALAQPASALALKIPGVGSVLAAIDSTLAKASPRAADAISPIIPATLVAAVLELAGQKMRKPALQDAGKALMITNIVSLGASIGEVVSSTAGLRGVDFTLGRRRKRGLRGVDFTRTGVGAIPALRGLTAKDNADFGRMSADFGAGIPGETIRSAAGTYKTPADFGAIPAMRGVDFTRTGVGAVPVMRGMGAIPAMRGYAHTGDVQLPEDDGDIYPEEAADHMI